MSYIGAMIYSKSTVIFINWWTSKKISVTITGGGGTSLGRKVMK